MQNLLQRVGKMEAYLDLLNEIGQTQPELLETQPEYKWMLEELKEYFESGQWQQDYESDERGEFPPDFKRGVLAQDTLFDFLSELK